MPNDFIFIEKPWGSFFFKHLGQKSKLQAKRECSNAGSTHLPIPRSFEENEFYRTQFGNKSLWLDISKADDSYDYQDSSERIFSSIIRTNGLYNEFIQIDKYDWATFNLSQSDREARYTTDVIMLANGQYGAVGSNDNALNEAVCVYNIISEQDCTRCLPGFCQYTNNEFNETECVCPKTRRGKNCEIDLCSHCRNGGTCRIRNGTNETECICPRPFDGENCELNLCPHCKNGAYCTISDKQLSTNMTNLTSLTNLTNLESPTNLTNLTNLSESECICVASFHGQYCELGKFNKILNLFCTLRL